MPFKELFKKYKIYTIVGIIVLLMLVAGGTTAGILLGKQGNQNLNLPANAATFTSGNLTYSTSGTNATVTDCSTSASGSLSIPSTVSNGGTTYTVTEIGNRAFSSCNSLTIVSIPNSVTEIGRYAFESCSGLTEITIPNSIIEIGNGAFQLCDGLTEVVIPDSVTSLGSSVLSSCRGLTSVTIGNSVTSLGNTMFQNCSRLTSITIPNSVTSIDSSAFENCRGLTSINVNSSNSNYSSINGILFNKNQTTLVKYPAGKTSTSYTIPNSVTSIGSQAFDNCSRLISITIPDSVNEIGYATFEGCSGLASVTIPDSVTSLGGSAFQSCSGLTSITIGNSVTSIGTYMFFSCRKLTSITIPVNVTEIRSSAFYACSGLQSITIPKSVTSIDSSAFYNCSSLTRVYYAGDINDWVSIDFGSRNASPLNNSNANLYLNGQTSTPYVFPSNLNLSNATKIGSYSLYGQTGITSVTIGDNVASIGEYAFQSCSGLTSVRIGNEITGIGRSAFENCSSVTSITIPNSVTSIGIYAFRYCTSLNNVYFYNDISTNTLSIGSYAFGNGSSTVTYWVKDRTSLTNIQSIYNASTSKFTGNNFQIMPGDINVAVATNSTGMGTVSGGGTDITYNTPVILTAIPNAGYEVAGWTLSSDGSNIISGSEGQTNYTITAAGDETYYAVFQLKQYNITVNVATISTGMGTVSGGGTVTHGSQITIYAYPNVGYFLLGWTLNGDGSNIIEDTKNTTEYTINNVTSDATYYAVFQKLNNLTITADSTLGQILINGEFTTNYTTTFEGSGSISNVVAVAKQNSAFLYWLVTTSSGSTQMPDNPLSTSITEDTTITAVFSNSLMDGIGVTALGGGQVRMGGYIDDGDPNTTVVLNAICYSGWTFDGWYTMENGVLTKIDALGNSTAVTINVSAYDGKLIIARFVPNNNGNVNDNTNNT